MVEYVGVGSPPGLLWDPDPSRTGRSRYEGLFPRTYRSLSVLPSPLSSPLTHPPLQRPEVFPPPWSRLRVQGPPYAPPSTPVLVVASCRTHWNPVEESGGSCRHDHRPVRAHSLKGSIHLPRRPHPRCGPPSTGWEGYGSGWGGMVLTPETGSWSVPAP